MLGDVGGRAAVLAAEGEALQQTQDDQQDGCRDADGLIRGQQADAGRGHAHEHDGDEEGVLAPDEIPEAAEHERAERPHEKPCGERQQREDEPGGLVDAREELPRDDR